MDPEGTVAVLAPYKRIISVMTAMISILTVIGVLGTVGSSNAWNPVGWVILGSVALVTIAGTVYIVSVNDSNITISKRSKIPSKLKTKENKDKLKTPDSHPDEFQKDKNGDYIHKKTKWKYHKDKSGHFKGPHWDVSPKNGKAGDYYDVGLDGSILK